MENARGILIMFLLTTFLQNSTGQVLMDEFLFQHNSCYGSNRDYSIVNANCSADNVIAVSRVQAGVKLNNSSCPIVLDDNTTVDFENCCKIIADDCVVNVLTTNWHTLCSGNESCVSAPAVSVPSNCTSMFRPNTSSMQLDYYCINITRIGSTCTQVTMTTSENALYLWNAGYSSGVNADTDCVFSIQVESCAAHIEVTAMRINLEDDNGTCIQNITFSDSFGNPEMVIDCSKQYDITPLFTSTTNYLSMNFISDRNNTLGKYWIRFKAKEAKSDLHVDCNPAEQQMSCTTTSTKTTSSTTTTTTTTTQKTTTATNRTTPTTATIRTTPTTASNRTTPTTETRTPPTTAAPTITTSKSSTTTRKTETRPEENLEYIVLAALVPIVPLILYCLRKRKPVKPTPTPSAISLTDEVTSTTLETDTQTSEGSTSDLDETSNFSTTTSFNFTPTTQTTTTTYTSTTITQTTSTTTTTTVTSTSPSPPTFVSDLLIKTLPTPQVICSSDVQPVPRTNDITPTDDVNVISTTTRTPTPTTETTHTTIPTPSPTRPLTSAAARSVLTSDPPPLCACSFCGHPGKHYHQIASIARKYSKKKHFRCLYCKFPKKREPTCHSTLPAHI